MKTQQTTHPQRQSGAGSINLESLTRSTPHSLRAQTANPPTSKQRQTHTRSTSKQNAGWPTSFTPPGTTNMEEATLDETPFTAYERTQATNKMNSGKATGPDLIPAETLKVLTDPQLQSMAEFLTAVVQTAQTPEQWDHSTVVGIYKGKGAHTDPAMYRPITLLNTTYKLFARLIQTRMAK